MPRIAGVNIPENKKIEIALTNIFGMGLSLSRRVLDKAQIDRSLRASKLTSDQLSILRTVIEKECKIEGELKRGIITDIRRLKNIGCWKGFRHSKGLPVRGQQTRTNSRTVRGNVKRTVGSGRKKPPSAK